MKLKGYLLKWCCILIACTFLLTCKRQEKLKEVFDPEWRDESTKISLEICTQILTCFQKKFSHLKTENLHKYIEKNLQNSVCAEKHKKSNVYLLRGDEPEIIKKNFLTCYQKLQNLNCEEIYKDKISKISECNWISNLQKL